MIFQDNRPDAAASNGTASARAFANQAGLADQPIAGRFRRPKKQIE
jgi:hypothetical protein